MRTTPHDHAHQETGLDDATVFNMLVDAVRAELRRTFAAKDTAAYREAWRWPYEMDMVLFPDGWSPRVRDPVYRRAMVEFSVETCILQNNRKPDRGLQARLQATHDAVRSHPSEKTCGAYVRALHADGMADAAAFKEAGFFHLHPDKVDDETWARIGVNQSVMALRGKMSEGHFAMLRAAAGIETIEVAPVVIGPASCGHCGGPLLVVDGAQTVVCEACGHAVNRGGAFPCPTCGAHLLVCTGQQATKCAWCTTVISVVA